jgi:ubiquinone biosynthesis monooxygenase Coq7
MSFVDHLIVQCDVALRAVTGVTVAARPCPVPDKNIAASHSTPALTAEEKRLSASLMRVDHVGEVCAQALYQAQALATPRAALKEHFALAAQEERDHLAWTAQRLTELGGRPSWFNPVWYAGAFALGWVAGRMGDALSLGFVTQTEKLVEAHIDEHLLRLPKHDERSRAILLQMKEDEMRHAEQARLAGGREIPRPLVLAMTCMGKVMTRTAERI